MGADKELLIISSGVAHLPYRYACTRTVLYEYLYLHRALMGAALLLELDRIMQSGSPRYLCHSSGELREMKVFKEIFRY